MRDQAGFLAIAFVTACATTSELRPARERDTRDDPATLRPGFGNEETHTWWPLTPPEVAAIRRVDDARRGDAHALLALGLVASGDHRDDASYAAFTARVDQFLAQVRPTIEAAADDWHKGYELHRAMHRVFFNGERTELGSYDFAQARLTGIFTQGRYNCLSSTVLFAVLARAFDMPVRAVSVPTHVFIEMGATGANPGRPPIEVETTSDTGFDWVHDARFYSEDAARWSGNRGLRPVTFEEYQHREILAPYRLMALAMRDSRSGDGELDRMRLRELAAIVDPDDVEADRTRMQVYGNEAVVLYKAEAWRTMTRLFDVVWPAVAGEGARSRDADTLDLVSWAMWNRANAFTIIGRVDEAMALVTDGLARLDPAWKDAAHLKQNYLVLLDNRLGEIINAKDFAGAAKFYLDHREVCRADEFCSNNTGIAYQDWSNDYQRAGDWQAARKVLQDCVAELPAHQGCRMALDDLESRHRF
jgi:hypothetical protein